MNRTYRVSIGIGCFALAACLSGVPAFSQSAQDDPQNRPPVDQQQGPNDQYQNGQYGNAQDSNGQTPTPQVNQAPVPKTLTLPAGTVLSVRTTGQLSSERNQVGDQFSATLEQPLIANGWVVARRGQIVTGRVVAADKGTHSKPSQLGVQAIELTLVDGQILPVNTQLTKSSATPGSQPGRDVATVGTTTVLGAIIGAAAGGGTGAAIGAGVGATTGGAVVLSTRGKPTILYAETPLTFRLEAPLQISTEQGQVAFQPVRPSDYSRGNGDQDLYARPPLSRRPGPYGPYGGPGYYAAPYPYWGYYPYVPTVGFYGYFGGPRFYGGFRGFRR